MVPNAAFQGLAVDKWYRWETDVNLTSNLIVEIRLTDIAASTTVRHRPTGWYLFGAQAADVLEDGGVTGGPVEPQLSEHHDDDRGEQQQHQGERAEFDRCAGDSHGFIVFSPIWRPQTYSMAMG